MARNKYPEETVQKIIDAATQLFMEKGYDNTSIQDIINRLQGLSKGAIYHHFHSKEEILEAVMNHIYRNTESQMRELMEDKTLNGAQKLAKMFEGSVSDISQQQMFSIAVNLNDNPQMFVYQLKNTVEEVSKFFIYPIVLEAIADGSFPDIPYPLEFTETFMLLANIWMNPMIFVESPERVEDKLRFLQQMIKGLGIETEIISETIVSKLVEYTKLYNKNKKK